MRALAIFRIIKVGDKNIFRLLHTILYYTVPEVQFVLLRVWALMMCVHECVQWRRPSEILEGEHCRNGTGSQWVIETDSFLVGSGKN